MVRGSVAHDACPGVVVYLYFSGTTLYLAPLVRPFMPLWHTFF